MRRLLTPEQQEKMKQLRRQGRGPRGRPSRPAGGATAGPEAPGRGAAARRPSRSGDEPLRSRCRSASPRSRVPPDGGALAREAERELVEACRRGEREAFDRLVERYQRDVYRLCYRYVNNHEDANDLAQEVFLKAWRAIGRFRGESSLRTWLYRIGVNACLNFRALRRPVTQELPEALADPLPGARRPGRRATTRRAACARR